MVRFGWQMAVRTMQYCELPGVTFAMFSSITARKLHQGRLAQRYCGVRFPFCAIVRFDWRIAIRLSSETRILHSGKWVASGRRWSLVAVVCTSSAVQLDESCNAQTVAIRVEWCSGDGITLSLRIQDSRRKSGSNFRSYQTSLNRICYSNRINSFHRKVFRRFRAQWDTLVWNGTARLPHGTPQVHVHRIQTKGNCFPE